MADGKNEEIKNALKTIAQKYKLNFFAWLEVEGGQGWLRYEQIEENEFKIRVSMPGDFNVYNRFLADTNDLFGKYGAALASETDYKYRVIGTQKELIYVDKTKLEQIRAAKPMATGNVFHIGTINAQGGSVVFGDLDNSKLFIDNSVIKIKCLSMDGFTVRLSGCLVLRLLVLLQVNDVTNKY